MCIKDFCLQENKTPYDLAKEKKQTIMIAMIDAYRKSGIAGLAKYEKNEKSQSSLTDTENGLAFNDLVGFKLIVQYRIKLNFNLTIAP